MLEAIRKLFSSAKFLTLVAALVVLGVAKLGFEIDQETAGMIAALFAVLLGAQGAADHGKEAARYAATATPPPAQTQTVNVEAAKAEP